MMLRLFCLLFALTFAIAPAAFADDATYAQARDAIDRLRDQNRELQQRLDARLIAVPTDRLVTVSLPGELLTPDAHRQRFVWDFGDPHSGSPPRPGFNAAHLYQRPGTYAVTLNGKPYARVVVGERDEASVVRLPAGEVRGPVVAPRGSLVLGHPDGTTVTFTADFPGVDATAGNVTVRGVDFRQDDLRRFKGMCVLPGDATAWVDSTVERAAYGVVVEPGTVLDGLHLERVRQIGLDTLGAYLVGLWGNSVSRVTVYDTASDNSVGEHVLRFSGSGNGPGTVLSAVVGCTLANISEREGGPRGDIGKGSLILQDGSFGYVADNVMLGPVEIGPLKGKDGEKNPASRFKVARVETSRFSQILHFMHGLSGATLDRCLVEGAIEVQAQSDKHGNRRVEDLVIENTRALCATIGGGSSGIVLDAVVLTGFNGGQWPKPALALPPGMAGVTLSGVSVPLLRSWPFDSVVTVGGDNAVENYRRPGEVAGVSVAR